MLKGLLKLSCFLNLILRNKPGYSAVLIAFKSGVEEAPAQLHPAAPRPPEQPEQPELPHQHFGVTQIRFPRPAEPGTQPTSAHPTALGGAADRCFYLFTFFNTEFRSSLGMKVC